MNSKLIYLQALSDAVELLTIDEVGDYVADDLGLEYKSVLAEPTRLDVDEHGRVDENMFLAL